MVALKLVFQSLASVGAVVGVAGGGYYAYNLADDLFLLVTATVNTDLPTKDLITSTPTKPVPDQPAIKSGAENPVSGVGAGAIMSFFLTEGSIPSAPQAEQTTTVITPPPTTATNAPTEGETEETKNYTCKFEKVEDKKCELYSLTFDSTKKSLFSASIKSLIEKPDSLTKVKAKNELKINNFFLLKASSSLHKEWKFDGTKTINLASTEESAKSFSTITVHAKFEIENSQGTTNFAIAKAPATIPTTIVSAAEAETTTTYTCQLANKEKSACELSKFSEDSLSELNFSAITFPATTTPLTFETNKYYLIKWTSTNKHSFEDLKPQTVVVVEETSGTDTTKKTFNFTLEAPVMVLPTTATTTVEQALILK